MKHILERIQENSFIKGSDLKEIDITVSQKDYKELKKRNAVQLFRNVFIEKGLRDYQFSTPMSRALAKAFNGAMNRYLFGPRLLDIIPKNTKQNTVVKFKKYKKL